MSPRRHFTLVTLVVMAMPAVACAQATRYPVEQAPWVRQPAVSLQALYRQGWEQGRRAGLDDARRGETFRYTDEADYRRTEAVLRQSGYDSRYRDQYRRGYDEGYRAGYSAAYADARGPAYGGSGRGRGVPPGWSNGRGVGTRGGWAGRYDPAFQIGATDGYESGLNDARGRREYDPISEGRYRAGDRGYQREYGSLDVYKANYREGFRAGYQEGYLDAGRFR